MLRGPRPLRGINLPTALFPQAQPDREILGIFEEADDPQLLLPLSPPAQDRHREVLLPVHGAKQGLALFI